MPYPSEHAARIREPNDFQPDSFRRENDKFWKGIDVIFGKPKGSDKMEVQSIRFDAQKFSIDQVHQWLEKHGFKPIKVEPATSEDKPKNMASDTTKIMLYDSIGEDGTGAQDFIAELRAIKTPKIDLHINSYGGEITEGLAIANAIKDHPSEITAHIDGIAASIASIIAIAADRVCVARNAFVMIHNGIGKTAGDPSAMRKHADILDKMCDSIAQAYSDKTGKSVAEVRKAMDEETWFNAEEAKAWGLVDEIEDPGNETDLAASVMLAVGRYDRVPRELRQFAAQWVGHDNLNRKAQNMDKIECRDGKWYHGDKEVDVTACMAAAPPVPPKPGPEEEEEEQETEENKAQEKAKAMAEGVKQEREYRAMFSTILATTKLDATAAADFEKQFYGRSETDLKFLASHAIGQRATPVGEEGAGNAEGHASDEEKADKALVAACEKRFADDKSFRRVMGCASANPEDATYKAKLARYIAAERKCVRDQAHAGKPDAEFGDRSGDPISRVLRNRSIVVHVK